MVKCNFRIDEKGVKICLLATTILKTTKIGWTKTCDGEDCIFQRILKKK